MPSTKDAAQIRRQAQTIRTLQEAIEERNRRETSQLDQIRQQRAQIDTLTQEVKRLSMTIAAQDANRDNLLAQTKKQYRVLRLVEYAGDRDAVEDQVRQSIHGTVLARRNQLAITAVTLHEYPEVLKIARVAESVNVDTSDRQDGMRAGIAQPGGNLRNRE